MHAAGFYDEHDIELMTGTTVTAIDPAGSRLTLDGGGGELAYDKLLLTTGSEPRRIEAPGAELDGIYYLRSLADCDVLRRRLDDSGRVAVVGAGWIGSEFAASARQLGLEVTVIDPLALPERAHLRPRDRHASTATCTCGTASRCSSARGSRRSRATARSRACARAPARSSSATSPWSGSGSRRGRRLAADAGLAVDNGIVANERLETVGAGHLRGRRCRQRLASVLRAAHPRRALGQRAQPGSGRGPGDARRGRELRPDSVLLLRPVRRRHGVLGLCDELGRGRVPR